MVGAKEDGTHNPDCLIWVSKEREDLEQSRQFVSKVLFFWVQFFVEWMGLS
jgi:hypothetical protein